MSDSRDGFAEPLDEEEEPSTLDEVDDGPDVEDEDIHLDDDDEDDLDEEDIDFDDDDEDDDDEEL